MIKASEVASELRKWADRLDTMPDVKIDQPFVYMRASRKEDLVACVSSMPRPLTKEFEDYDIKVRYESDGLKITTAAPRNVACEIVEPAKPAVYRCISLLSSEDESFFEEAANG